MTTSDKARSDHPQDDVGQAVNVVNVSGANWPGAQMRPRGRTMPTTPPGQHLSPRTARMIDAQSGEQLDHELGQRLTTAAQRKASIRATVDRANGGPLEREYLDHVFGHNLPGRGRA